jgi:TctA family transporter
MFYPFFAIFVETFRTDFDLKNFPAFLTVVLFSLNREQTTSERFVTHLTNLNYSGLLFSTVRLAWTRTNRSIVTMALLPNFDEIAKQFVQQYYSMFDNADMRPNLASFYAVSAALIHRK